LSLTIWHWGLDKAFSYLIWSFSLLDYHDTMRRYGIMFERILVPLDGSEIAESVLPYVEDLASTHKSKIVLLRVALAHTLPGQDEIKAEVSVVREAEEYLKGVEERLKKEGFAVESHVRYGKGAEEIVDFCQEPNIDAVAMFTHGRAGIGRWLLGSVAEKVVHHCPIPTLLFRPKGQ
jgi:nucleotide-binding universal stress UspA family protein